MSETSRCPCGRAVGYARCCEPLHLGTEQAPTAERLMRSRYSAFALGQRDYLLRTWHPSTRPAALDLDDSIEWRHLLVERVEAGGPFDEDGYVTFTAIARSPEGRFEQRERSRFVRLDGAWSYIDGEEA